MKYNASVDMILTIEYEGIEAENEEEAKRIAIDKAYEDVDFNNCYCEDNATACVWEVDETEESGESDTQCEI